MREAANGGLPKEAREEVDHLIDYVKGRLGEGVDRQVLSAAAAAVAKALAETCCVETLH